MSDAAISIEVNGERRAWRPLGTVADLVAELALPRERIAVELNRALLPRSRFDEPLRDGDRLEIVTFVGGG